MFRDQGGLFSYVSPESRVPPGRLLRKIRRLVRAVLTELSRSFARLYAKEGRPSVPPEQLLSALLLQALYGSNRGQAAAKIEPAPDFERIQTVIDMDQSEVGASPST
jgi:hypothetical protein